MCACQRIATSLAAQTVNGVATKRQRPRRLRQAAAWGLPSIALALVPKCPMCIAAYFAIGGGLGVSLSTAGHLRTALVWLCWGVLALLAARVAMRWRLGRYGLAAARRALANSPNIGASI